MKTVQRDELYQHLSGFLQTKGIEFKDGLYPKRIQKCCGLLTDAINASQRGLEKAKDTIDTKLDQVRQVIHEKTAPKPRPTPPPQPAASAAPPQPEAAPPVQAAASAAAKKNRRPRKKTKSARRGR